MSDTYTPETHRMRDAVANADWMDAGRVTPETIREGYAEFDDWLAQVRADARRDALLEAADEFEETPHAWGKLSMIGHLRALADKETP